jgi:uncharacterized protein (DUF433 family)
MVLSQVPVPFPLLETGDGAVLVGGTRVTLDSVVASYRSGATAEEIVQQYPALDLADVHLTIGYFLRHESEVDAYLQRRREEAETIRQEVERRSPQQGIRARLLARRKQTGKLIDASVRSR